MGEGWGLGTGVPLPMGHGSEARFFGAATIGSGVEHQEATQAKDGAENRSLWSRLCIGTKRLQRHTEPRP